MANILKGAPVAKAISEELLKDVDLLKSEGINPTLAILRIGEKEDDLSYEKGAMKRCEKIGITVKNFVLPPDVEEKKVLEVIDEINNDKGIHGALIFRPFPKHLDDTLIRNRLAPEKDLDGISDSSLVGVFADVEIGFPPCTARACMEVLKYYGYDLKGKRAVVIGRSLVIGKPVSMMLLKENATVTICHSRTNDIPEVSKQADIVIAAVGRAEMVNKDYLSKGQVVIDVGINITEDGYLKGDVLFEDAEKIVEAVTPVPSGVGSVTTAVLAKHLLIAAKKTRLF